MIAPFPDHTFAGADSEPFCFLGGEKWFSANGIAATALDDEAPAFDIGNVLASAESFRVSVAGPPPTV
ncbi:hypothetical protein [Streptomyces sp. NPDC057287]|uniref:hypothetical protein n=1 Tax=Streptomyces sp. NPDC057287 TaxID=3346086 RepID=UPI003630839C